MEEEMKLTDDLSSIVEALQEANIQNNLAPIEEQDFLSEEEALQIYHEIVNVFNKHNISYRSACNISISMMYAFLSGAAELYDEFEEENP